MMITTATVTKLTTGMTTTATIPTSEEVDPKGLAVTLLHCLSSPGAR